MECFGLLVHSAFVVVRFIFFSIILRFWLEIGLVSSVTKKP